ncbi:MAG: thiaminase II [Dehalococcoidia bacterium]|nr:thiaminase II [Dehalococcoidia bacterium]
MSNSEILRERHAHLWDRLFRHPFVVGMGTGQLPLEKFQFYVKQDYFFLVQYRRMLALATAKAPGLANVSRFADLLKETLDTEMSLHRAFCAKFGVSSDELESTRPAPITLAYTDYLLRVAYEGTITDVVANLLPCQWGYVETGLYLSRTGDTSEQNRYAEWIHMYSSEEFTAFVGWLREFLDDLTSGADEREVERLSDHFLTATRYEYLFWEMAYHLQDWPI